MTANVRVNPDGNQLDGTLRLPVNCARQKEQASCLICGRHPRMGLIYARSGDNAQRMSGSNLLTLGATSLKRRNREKTTAAEQKQFNRRWRYVPSKQLDNADWKIGAAYGVVHHTADRMLF